MPTMTAKPGVGTVENIYCTKCGKTTRHKKGRGSTGSGFTVDDNYTCDICGSVKRAIAKRLDEALGLMESVDEPVLFTHEGLRKKSQAGAHRFDKGVEYSQMEFDGKWGTKSKQDKLGS